MPDQFRGQNHLGDTVSLLCSEQAQSISQNCSYTAVTIVFIVLVSTQPSICNNKCHKAQICLGLASTSGKVEKIHDFAVIMLRIYNTFQIHENKSNLERSPAKIIGRIARIHKIPKGALNTGSMLLREIHNISLKNHGTIHKAKGIKRNIILYK